MFKLNQLYSFKGVVVGVVKVPFKKRKHLWKGSVKLNSIVVFITGGSSRVQQLTQKLFIIIFDKLV